MIIAKDKVVAMHYTLTDPAGTVLDSSQGAAPLAYLHGAGGIIPGLERALAGKAAGDVIDVVVQPADGYGLRQDALIQEVDRSAFGEMKVEKGMQFRAESGTRDSRVVTVVDVEADKVRVDANHPLAGQTLHFEVKIVSVRNATAEELAHGHAHGAGGHHHH